MIDVSELVPVGLAVLINWRLFGGRGRSHDGGDVDGVGRRGNVNQTKFFLERIKERPLEIISHDRPSGLMDEITAPSAQIPD